MLVKDICFSTIDYPSFPSYVVFTIGCNFRCTYCHNPELWTMTTNDHTPISTVINKLEKRVKIVNKCVVCGGEPTIHEETLPQFLSTLKKIGYDIKLDTNGYNPNLIKLLISERLIDFVDMDVKAPPERYNEIANVNVDVEKILESIALLKDNKSIKSRFRTVILPFFTQSDISSIKTLTDPHPHIFTQYKDVYKKQKSILQ